MKYKEVASNNFLLLVIKSSMTAKMSWVKEFFFISDKVNNGSMRQLCQSILYYKWSNQQGKYNGVASSNSLLLVIKSTMKVQSSFVKQFFITSFKVSNESTGNFYQIILYYYLSSQQWNYKEVLSNKFFISCYKVNNESIRKLCQITLDY